MTPAIVRSPVTKSLPSGLDGRGGEGPGRVDVGREEVGALEVGIAVRVASAQGGRVEHGGDGGALDVLADDDGALGDGDGAHAWRIPAWRTVNPACVCEASIV